MPDTSFGPEVVVRNVHRGPHRLTVELVDAEGQSFEPRLVQTVDFSTRNVLEALETELFSLSCSQASCHGGPAPRAGLDLGHGDSHDELVMVEAENDAAREQGMMRVVPFDVEGSFLWMKIEDPAPEYGDRMPQTGPPVPAAQRDRIRTWIEQGALTHDF